MREHGLAGIGYWRKKTTVFYLKEGRKKPTKQNSN